jgi:hypothetical protein
MITVIVAIAGSIVRGLLLRPFLSRSRPAEASRQADLSPLPAAGAMVTGDFTWQGELIHALCRVEEQQGSGLLLRIVAEMGRLPLVRLRPGTTGQLEVGAGLLPLEVVRVDFPWVEVMASPERARPAPRQALRVPASFSVRFRPQGVTDPWMTGTGMNLGAGGFCFFAASPPQPALGLIYELEITLACSRRAKEQFLLEGEVRWVAAGGDGAVVGLRVTASSRRAELARALFRLQHQMARRPEDYLAEGNPKPHSR